nr:DUF3800 domain-containing protein [Mobiluncus mulieris]
MFIDESGSKSSAGKFFVLGMVKTYLPGKLSWQLRNVKERFGFKNEFKFTKVTQDTLPVFKKLVEVAYDSSTLLAAFVADSTCRDQFGNRPVWKAQADMTTQLVSHNLVPGEVACVFADVITTPRAISLAETVKRQTNFRLKRLAVANGVDLDSQACMELQLADLFAGAVSYERRLAAGIITTDGESPKARLVEHLKMVYGCDSLGDRSGRLIKIHTAQN